jgi:hypothetical protein
MVIGESIGFPSFQVISPDLIVTIKSETRDGKSRIHFEMIYTN